MSRRCSQVAIRRVLALSTTLMSLVPQNPTPPVYLSTGGSNSVTASGSTGLRLEEPWAWLTRWYPVIMQSTWFPRLRASRGNTSGWRCVISWWLHYDEPVAAALNACRSHGWRCAFPPHPGVGGGRWACFCISLTVTVDVSLAYTF